ncbi:MAG: ATP-binding cassette domain-containing protein [Eubacteriales bacterium]|nr:ATP-binding cassette domain-containing protein [Eubacteriales bacterium]
MEKIIEFRRFSFMYPGTEEKALDEIDLSVSQGEMVLLTGPSGCGKTTLLRQMKKSLVPYGKTDGTVLFRGKEIVRMDGREAASAIGFVFQSPEDQIVTNKVWHELAFGLENLGLPREEMERRIAETVSFFGISDIFEKDTASLSGGEMQLLNLASVIAMDPEVLLLDEPTGQLDPVAAGRLLDAVSRIHQELGTTVILSEHRLERAFAAADRVIRMDRGRIVGEGTPRELAGLCQLEDLDVPVPPRIWAGLKNLEAISEPSPEPAGSGLGRSANGPSNRENALPDEGDFGSVPMTVGEGRAFLNEYADARFGNADSAEKTKDPLPYERPGLEKADRKKNGKKKGKPADPILALENIYFRYAGESPDILKGASFALQEGTIAAIAGGNGSGKSTFLRIIAGVLKPEHGTYRAFGKKIRSAGELIRGKGGMALLPQDPKALFHGITAEEEFIEMQPEAKSPEEDLSRRREREALFEKLGISGKEEVHPYDLSGGEQERLAFGKLLLLDSRVLLLDEPTKGLDPYEKRRFGKILRAFSDSGKTILLVTHDLEFAALYADSVSMLFDGRLTEPAPPDAFFRRNRFYTTAAARMSGGLPLEGVTAEQVVRNAESAGNAEDERDAGDAGVPEGMDVREKNPLESGGRER